MSNIGTRDLMSRAAFARHMGVTNGTVSKAIRRGVVIVDEKTNLVKVAESKARWPERNNPPLLGRGDLRGPDPRADVMGVPPPGSLTEARARHEATKRELAELRLRKARGELIDRERTLETVFNLARETRDSFLTWPARYASVIAARLHTDPHLTELVLDQCIKAHLRELGKARVTL